MKDNLHIHHLSQRYSLLRKVYNFCLDVSLVAPVIYRVALYCIDVYTLLGFLLTFYCEVCHK